MRLPGATALTIALAACASPSVTPRPVGADSWTEVLTPGSTELRCAGIPVLRTVHEYDPARHAETFKAYTHVHGPDGEGPLTKGETTGLYPHHKGIFVGWNKVLFRTKRYDFWHGTGGVSFRLVSRASDLRGPVPSQTFRFAWTLADGTQVLAETRTLRVTRREAGRLAVEVTSVLAAEEDVELDGDAHHAGCHIRLAQEFADHEKENEARLPPSARRVKADDESVWVDCPWAALAGKLSGKSWVVTVQEGEGAPPGGVTSVRRYGRVGIFHRTKVTRISQVTLRHTFTLDPAVVPCAWQTGKLDPIGPSATLEHGHPLRTTRRLEGP